MGTRPYNQEIDIAKGIGMILLVIGHLLMIDTPGFKVIFAFHMPLFFFLSGTLFCSDRYSRSDFFGKKISRLIISYLMFTIIGGIFYAAILKWEMLSIKPLIISTFYSGQPTVNNNLWFLATLSLVMCIFYLVPFFSQEKMRLSTSICIIIGCLLLSWLFTYIPLKFLPFKLNSVPLAFIFFFIGNRFGKVRKFHIVKKSLILGGVIFLALLLIFAAIFNSRVDLRLNYMGNPILFIIGSLSGIALILLLSKYIKSPVVAMIGRLSFVFFALETYVRESVNLGLNRLIGTDYKPIIDLPIEFAAIEFVIIIVCLTVITKFFSPIFFNWTSSIQNKMLNFVTKSKTLS